MFSRPGQLGMKAGADFEQADRRGRGARRGPSVGSVMRDRILSSVLLPAPLRPMMPTHFARHRREAHVAQRPDVFSFFR